MKVKDYFLKYFCLTGFSEKDILKFFIFMSGEMWLHKPKIFNPVQLQWKCSGADTDTLQWYGVSHWFDCMCEGTLKTMVKKLLLNFSYLKSTHKLFPIKGHILSAHLFEGNVPISHEWNAWILMNFVIAAKPPHLTHIHPPCIQSGDLWPCSRALAACKLTFVCVWRPSGAILERLIRI